MCAARLLVQAECHQGHDLDDPKTPRKGPSEQFPVAGWQQETGATELGSGRDQRLQPRVARGDGVSEKADAGGVAAGYDFLGMKPGVLDYISLEMKQFVYYYCYS